jgi:hypothetical protein
LFTVISPSSLRFRYGVTPHPDRICRCDPTSSFGGGGRRPPQQTNLISSCFKRDDFEVRVAIALWIAVRA